jgi:hypothetical protein
LQSLVPKTVLSFCNFSMPVWIFQSMKKINSIPEAHPVKKLFHDLTGRALGQASLHDKDIHFYLSNLLVDFISIDNLYRTANDGERQSEYLIDMLQQANDVGMPEKKDAYRHVGDFSLYMLGMFPEYIGRRRSALSASYYSDFGRIGYQAAGDLESDSWRIRMYRKLAERFESCVESLHWVREYTTDPFYQYMLREFNIT